jgi:hypothetical protein
MDDVQWTKNLKSGKVCNIFLALCKVLLFLFLAFFPEAPEDRKRREIMKKVTKEVKVKPFVCECH